jgi:hypothetical protein
MSTEAGRHPAFKPELKKPCYKILRTNFPGVNSEAKKQAPDRAF